MCVCCQHAGSVLTAGCLAAIGAVMAVSVPVVVTPDSTQQPGKQLPLLVALLSIYSVVAEASIGGLSITGREVGGTWLLQHVWLLLIQGLTMYCYRTGSDTED